MARHREEPPPLLVRCDACGTTDQPLEPAIVEGHTVVMCVHPVACRMRAQAKGIYLVGSEKR